MAMFWNDEALARSGLTRESAMLALAVELTDLPSKVRLTPPDDVVADAAADRLVVSKREPARPKILYTEGHIRRLVALHDKMFRRS